jgi:clan AA aspartic protease (TIGR02281 family)
VTVPLLAAFLTLAVGATAVQLNEAGKAAYERGDFAQAERLFRRAILDSPREPILHYHLAVTLTRQRRWREAAEAYRTTLRLDPPSPLATAAAEGLRELGPALRPPPTRRAANITIQLRPLRGGWIADVVLNDSREARFLVDTGASLCVISPALAETLDIVPDPRSRPLRLLTLGGPTIGPLVTIESLRIGEAEARDVPAVVHALDSGIDGILGNSFLNRFLFSLDPQRAVLTLTPR